MCAVSELSDDVAAVVLEIPAGTVVSYAWVADEAGHPGAARAVGQFLALDPGPLPWWRVVKADGRFAESIAREQAARLRAEGVEVIDGRRTKHPPLHPGPRA